MKRNKRKQLPKGWGWERIGDHISNSQSGLACGEKSKEIGYPHLRMNNISREFEIDLNLLWRIPASDAAVERYSLSKGDLLFNNTNSSELVGKSCLFTIKTDEKFLFSNHLTRIRTKSSLSSRYLMYWIKSLWEKRYFEESCDKWVNQAAVRPEDVLFPYIIPFPPTFDDQIKIINELDSRMSKVERMRQAALQQLEAIQALPAAILREVFDFQEPN